MGNEEIIQYRTRGTCCKIINLKLKDGVVLDSEFLGGCSGNLQGIKSLIQGMKIEDVIKKLKGIDCNGKGTSCPDQLASCLIEYAESKNSTKAL